MITISTEWDHPRLRGKNFSHDKIDLKEIGSPPLTREKHSSPLSTSFNLGITPAYAGKTVIDPCMQAT